MKYLAIVAYSGEDYYGFQRQNGKRSVQGELEKQLSFLLGSPTIIKGAGRTDAGVHAKGQTFSFSGTIENIDSFLHALNRLLPEDIFVRSIKAVDEGFDARHSCIGKIYQYQFTVNDRDPLRSKKIAQIRRDDFQFEAFLQGLSVFSGTHNFQNFTTKPEDKDGFIRHVEILDAHTEEEGNLVSVTLKADGFMRYQIRLMIGAAIRVGTSRLSVEEVAARLNQSERNIMSYKAPAEGLCLLEVLYPR